MKQPKPYMTARAVKTLAELIPLLQGLEKIVHKADVYNTNEGLFFDIGMEQFILVPIPIFQVNPFEDDGLPIQSPTIPPHLLDDTVIQFPEQSR